MIRWQTLTGVFLGLLAGSAILAMTENSRRAIPSSGPILSECDGHFQELVIQYEPSAREIAATVYRDFLGALDRDIVVHALCPTQAAYDELIATVGPVRCRMVPLITGHAMTTWSRDRWVALEPPSPGRPVTLWSPRGEAGGQVWPARSGDEKVGWDIATASQHAVLARRSGLYFDGCDFLTDAENVFVMPRVLNRNIQQTVKNQQEFLDVLAREFKRNVILLKEAPDHHAGMFMASVGNKVMLVADPSLAKKMISTAQSPDEIAKLFPDLPGGPDFTAESQRLFDAVAQQCAAAGYKVIRIPVVPAHDSRTYLTYVNVLMDQQGDHRLVYLPQYQGRDALNTAARNVWESLGYEVHPVNCTAAYRHFGCLHCLVNVLQRS